MSLTKRHLIDRVYEHSGFRIGQSSDAVEALLELMKTALETGEDILISGFGKFCVREKSSRRGRNPETGEGLPLGARRVVTFTPSGVLRRKLNGHE